MTPRPLSHAEVVARFWSRVVKAEGEGCWLWTGSNQKRPNGSQGYGIFNRGKRRDRELAHRFSFKLANGGLPDDVKVCHKCDTPLCVRPDHLFRGTQADNLADMRAKGRAKFNSFELGTAHPNAKIDPDTVREIRALRASGLTFAKIGDRVGLHASTVHDIASRRTWAHVP